MSKPSYANYVVSRYDLSLAEELNSRAGKAQRPKAKVILDYDAFDIDESSRRRLFEIIGKTSNLNWLLITEYPENVLTMTEGVWTPTEWDNTWDGHVDKPQRRYEFPDNVWLGTIVRTQAEANERITNLLQVPAKTLFVVCNPSELVDLSEWLFCERRRDDDACGQGAYETPLENASGGCWFRLCRCSNIKWIVAAGETNPVHPYWFTFLQDQCSAAGVPFWFEGWGEWVAFHQSGLPSSDKIKQMRGPDVWRGNDPCPMYHVGKERSGRRLNGREWREAPNEQH